MNIDKKQLRGILPKTILLCSCIGFGLVVYEEGFRKPFLSLENSHHILSILLSLVWLGYVTQYFLTRYQASFSKRRLSELTLIVLVSILLFFILTDINFPGLSVMGQLDRDRLLVNVLTIIVFVVELSKVSLKTNQLQLNPPFIFIMSFLILIIIGTLLLMLPKATMNGIGLVDAVFTATSAVCVTGLIVLDTAKDFTFFGQLVIMVLFQLGGLGMMTFTSFFGFFFRGHFSIQNQLFLKDFINEDNFSKIFSTLIKIILFTFMVEGTAAVLIFLTLEPALFSSWGDMVFFSVFHSISAFCNAGFSILSDGLYQEGFRDNYDMQLTIAVSIVLGGIGFPVVVSYYGYLKHLLIGGLRKLFYHERYKHVPRLVSISTRLVVITTGVLLAIGFVSYWYFEKEATLLGLEGYGKFVTVLFGTVTPRTAGFNTVDMSVLTVPTILIYLLLMWIGASPGSTGGGLKTSTFAVSLLNAFSIAKGKDRVEVFKREISNMTLRKAFAVSMLSFLVIGLTVFLTMMFDPELPILQVVFEAFSAFSTVGLSLGITGDLSAYSKVVLVFTMFLGRVGTLTVLIAFTKGVSNLSYRYPEESVFIT